MHKPGTLVATFRKKQQKRNLKKILLILSFLVSLSAHSQITRGAQSAELYLSTDWFMDNNGDLHYGIFRSVDNGTTITLQYESSTALPPDEMGIGRVLGDATLGSLYNIGGGELWASYDYGISWEHQDDYSYASFATGFSNGEIFRRSDYNLYRSEDYGSSFDLIVESLTEPLSDVGNQNGQLLGFTGSAGVEYKLYHSLDYGNNFTFIPIDSSIAFWAPSGQFPKISRGTESGEIYLVSWTPELHYRIFHSIDTGYTWTEKFESDYIDIYYWSVQFTAGREPGSFYTMRARINPAGDHVWLYIDYSNDYGETFTTYFHDLDSTITNTTKIDNIKMSIYPNPFNDKISIETRPEFKMIEIFDINGKIHFLRKLLEENTTEIIDLRELEKGIYILKIRSQGQDITKKIIKI